jgi:hypothetical protein
LGSKSSCRLLQIWGCMHEVQAWPIKPCTSRINPEHSQAASQFASLHLNLMQADRDWAPQCYTASR